MNTFSRQIQILAAVCVLAASLFSCASGIVSGPDKIEKPAADSIAVREVLQPSGHAVCGDKAVLVSRKSENIFWVYRLPDFKFLYSFGKMGEGPDDFGACGFEDSDVRMPDVYVNEFSKYRITGYSVGDKTFKKGTVFTRKNTGRYRTACLAAGGRWILGTKFISGDAMGRERLYVVDSKDGTPKDSIMIYTFSTEVRSGNSVRVTGYNDMFALARGNRIAVGYEETQRIDFYDITPEGRLQTVKTIGETDNDEAVYAQAKERAESTDRTLLVDHCATENYLYLLEVHARFDVAVRRVDFVSCRVKVYDWDGNPVKIFELEKPASYIVVGKDDGQIFTYNNISADFDRVYVYRTGL